MMKLHFPLKKPKKGLLLSMPSKLDKKWTLKNPVELGVKELWKQVKLILLLNLSLLFHVVPWSKQLLSHLQTSNSVVNNLKTDNVEKKIETLMAQEDLWRSVSENSRQTLTCMIMVKYMEIKEMVSLMVGALITPLEVEQENLMEILYWITWLCLLLILNLSGVMILILKQLEIQIVKRPFGKWKSLLLFIKLPWLMVILKFQLNMISKYRVKLLLENFYWRINILQKLLKKWIV